MATTFIPRVQTITSLSDMDEEADGQAWGPTSTVGSCAGQPLPLYAYAPCLPPGMKYRLLPSRGDITMIGVVPEAADSPFPLSRSVSGSSLDCLSDGDGQLSEFMVPTLGRNGAYRSTTYRTTDSSSPGQDDAMDTDGAFDSMLDASADGSDSAGGGSSPRCVLGRDGKGAYCNEAAVAAVFGGATGASGGGSGGSGLLDVALTALWDDAMERGLFRYNVCADVTTRVVPGRRGYVAQLNEGRANNKRPTEFSVDAVVQPFDGRKFNFRKAYAREVLFQFEPAAVRSAAPQLLDRSECGESPNLVVINVSPIEYGHVLLVPRVNDCLPQLADPSTIELALHFAKEADSDAFRVGYNSLGAYATINHLHFQGYYLDHAFPIECADTEPLPQCPSQQALLRGGCAGAAAPPCASDVVRLSRTSGSFPVRAFVAELAPGVRPSRGLPALARLVGDACVALAAAGVPHNVFITARGRRVFLIPNVFSARMAAGTVPEYVAATGVNPAVFEISGHMLFKAGGDYAAADEASCDRLLACATVSEEHFCQLARELFGGGVCGNRA